VVSLAVRGHFTDWMYLQEQTEVKTMPLPANRTTIATPRQFIVSIMEEPCRFRKDKMAANTASVYLGKDAV